MSSHEALMLNELLSIYKLNMMLDLNQSDSFSNVQKEIERNYHFETAIGKRFQNKVQDIASGRSYDGMCAVCGKKCERYSSLLCNACEQAIHNNIQKNVIQTDSQKAENNTQDGMQSFFDQSSDAISKKIDRWFQTMNGQWPPDADDSPNHSTAYTKEPSIDKKATESINDYLYDIQYSIRRIERILLFWNSLVLVSLIISGLLLLGLFLDAVSR